MNKRSRVAFAAFLATAGVVLAGCGGGTAGTAGGEFAVTPLDADSFPAGVTLEDGYIITDGGMQVFLGGSSGCPPEIETVSVDDATVDIQLAAPSQEICTADLKMHGFDIVSAAVTDNITTVEVTDQQGTREIPPLG